VTLVMFDRLIKGHGEINFSCNRDILNSFTIPLNID